MRGEIHHTEVTAGLVYGEVAITTEAKQHEPAVRRNLGLADAPASLLSRNHDHRLTPPVMFNVKTHPHQVIANIEELLSRQDGGAAVIEVTSIRRPSWPGFVPVRQGNGRGHNDSIRVNPIYAQIGTGIEDIPRFVGVDGVVEETELVGRKGEQTSARVPRQITHGLIHAGNRVGAHQEHGVEVMVIRGPDVQRKGVWLMVQESVAVEAGMIDFAVFQQ